MTIRGKVLLGRWRRQVIGGVIDVTASLQQIRGLGNIRIRKNEVGLESFWV